MKDPALYWQETFDMYRKKALENGYTNEEVDRVEERVKWLFRNRYVSHLPRQLDLMWASHRLLCIEKEMEDLLND